MIYQGKELYFRLLGFFKDKSNSIIKTIFKINNDNQNNFNHNC